MEILKIWVRMPTIAEVDSNVNCAFATSDLSTSAAAFSDPHVFAMFDQTVRLTTSGMLLASRMLELDLTDGAGHGYLIATDQIFVNVVSTTTSAANTVSYKIMYRWKNVGLAEYIGIVQSQQ